MVAQKFRAYTPGFRTSARLIIAVALLTIAASAQRAAAGIIDTYIGGGNGDGSDASDASLDPRGLTTVGTAANADLYIADGRNNRVRHVDGRSGLIETVAGSGAAGFSGDGGSAVNASMNLPLDVARDSAGNLYIADMKNNRIRKVTPSGQISTFAGNGNLTYGGDNGLATQAALYNPYGVAVGPDGYVYIADLGNNRIRRVGPPGCSPSTCIITTVVGTGAWGYSGDGGPATAATLRNPADVAFDSAGNMLIADWSNHRIRKVSNGIMSTIAGGGVIVNGSIGDGGPALLGVLRYPTQVAADASGNVYIADSQQRRIRVVKAATQFIYTVAGTGTQGSSGDGGPAVEADMYDTWGIAVGGSGAFWGTQTADTGKSQHNRVRYVQDGIINSVVGGGLGDGGPAYDAVIDPRGGMTVQRTVGTADLYFADGTNHVVRWVDGATATMHTIAGTGTAGYSGDGGPATQAMLNTPTDVAVDLAGNVYIADASNSVVRRVDTRGTITTVAGNGTRGYSGDGGPATAAQLYGPTGLAVDNNGRLYIADNSNYRVRMVVDGRISTVAGTGASGYGGDGGPASAAKLQNPFDVAVTSTGVLYIADTWNHRIRRVDGNGTITTYAGNGFPGFSGDGGGAFFAQLNAPTLLGLDQSDTLYFADSYNHRIRSIASGSTAISTVAGNGIEGVAGDGGPATSASFSEPTGVGIDPAGKTLFIGSKDDRRVRVVDFGGQSATPSFTATPIPATSTPLPSTPTRTPTKTNTPGTQTGSISGAVTYYSNSQSVSGVEVDLVGPSNVALQTNNQALYSATVPQASWSVVPTKSGGFGSAISSLDAARVLQALAGLQRFTNQQRVACDATGDGSLSTLDAVYILQFSAGLIDHLPAAAMCGSDWIFYPSPSAAQNQVVIYPTLNAGTCQPGSIVLNPLVGSATGQGFDGILLGDCTGNWTAGMALRQRANGGAVVHAGAARRTRDGFVVPIYVKSSTPFQAMDLRLSYDAQATFVGSTVRGAAAGAIVSSHADGGRLSLSLASAQSIVGSQGSIVLLRFRGGAPSATLEGAVIDEDPARVLTHSRAR